MIKKPSIIILLITTLIGLQSCQKEYLSNSTATQNKMFLSELYSNNRIKILAAEVALQRTNNPYVIAFATELLSSHTKIESEILLLSISKGIYIEKTLLNYHQNNYNLLVDSPADQFDKNFAILILRLQAEEIVLLTDAIGAASAVDDSLKLWAAEQLPKVEIRYDDADLLRGKVS